MTLSIQTIRRRPPQPCAVLLLQLSWEIYPYRPSLLTGVVAHVPACQAISRSSGIAPLHGFSTWQTLSFPPGASRLLKEQSIRVLYVPVYVCVRGASVRYPVIPCTQNGENNCTNGRLGSLTSLNALLTTCVLRATVRQCYASIYWLAYILARTDRSTVLSDIIRVML